MDPAQLPVPDAGLQEGAMELIMVDCLQALTGLLTGLQLMNPMFLLPHPPLLHGLPELLPLLLPQPPELLHGLPELLPLLLPQPPLLHGLPELLHPEALHGLL